MTLRYIAATLALGAAALAGTPASAMPASNLAAVAPSNMESVHYCRYRGCGRVYVRRYAPSYYAYAPSYYGGYAYGPSYYGGYGYGGPSISFSFGGGRGFGGGGWGHRGRW